MDNILHTYVRHSCYGVPGPTFNVYINYRRAGGTSKTLESRLSAEKTCLSQVEATWKMRFCPYDDPSSIEIYLPALTKWEIQKKTVNSDQSQREQNRLCEFPRGQMQSAGSLMTLGSEKSHEWKWSCHCATSTRCVDRSTASSRPVTFPLPPSLSLLGL